MVMKITPNVALDFHPIFTPINQLFGAILEFGFWPPARGASRAYALEGFVVSLCSIIFL